MADDKTRKDFFISYTGADRSWAEWMAWQLEQANYSVMLQAWDFRPGGNFVLDMDQASRQCNRTIAVLSADYFKSKYTPSEWAAAFRQDPLSQQKRLLPVRVRECDIEGLLGQIVYIDLVGKDQEAARLALLAGVGSERAKPTTAPPFPVASPGSAASPPFPGVLPAIWMVPSLRNPYFTGREEPLQQLADAFEGAGSARMRQPMALSGLGGIGKTQIAIEYAYRSSARYQAVLWAQANTAQADMAQADTRAVLVSSFLRITDALNLPEKNEQDANRVVQAVKRWLQTHSGWLLILDNADDLALAREFLPAGSAGHVLLTTRAEVTAPLARRIGIDVLPGDVGARFLLQRAGLLALELPLEQAEAADQALARQLCDEMGGLPLALDQAGAYIQENACRLSDYLEWYRQRRMELLNERGELVEDHPASVATTWSLSFQKVGEKSPAAADLLRLCAFLDPDAIPEEMITKGAQYLGPQLQATASDPLALNKAITALRAYSLLRRDSTTHTLTMHRLVQAVLRDRMDASTQRGWAERAIRAVGAILPPVVYEHWPHWGRIVGQAQACAELVKQYHLHLAEAASLLQQTGEYFAQRHRDQEAQSLLEQALHIDEQGAEHLAIARDAATLGLLHRSRGKYAEAELLLKRALAIREQQLGLEHPDIAQNLIDLAYLYERQRKYAEAEPLLKRALAIREKQLGPEHPDTATSLIELAALYAKQRKYAQAEPLYQRALAIREKQLGPEHPDTAESLAILAYLYTSQRKYAEAEPLLKRALAIREQQLGLEHPHTAQSLAMLADLYTRQRKYAEAELLLKRTLTIREKQLGPEHPDTAESLGDLADFYASLGKYAEAEPLLKRHLTIYEQQLGPEHAFTVNSLVHLADFYTRQRKYAEAELLYQRALAIREKQLGPEHPNTAQSLAMLADFYASLRKYAEAEPLYQRALAIREQQLGLEHPDIAQSLSDLADFYASRGKYAEAEPLLKRALVIYEQQLGPEHPDTSQSLNNLAKLYYRQDKYAEAEPLYQRALAIREKQLGSEHPDTAISLSNLAELYYRQGKYEQAEPLLKRALAIYEQQLGPEHPDTATSLSNLAVLYREEGKYEQAKPLYQRALAIREQEFGPQHLNTVTIRASYHALVEDIQRRGKEQH